MDYQTRVSIVRNYELPQDIQDFIKDNSPIRTGYAYWISENGKLKI